jgi:hypothetical protein
VRAAWPPERRRLGELPRKQAPAARARPATVHARDRHGHRIEAHADAAAAPTDIAQTVAIDEVSCSTPPPSDVGKSERAERALAPARGCGLGDGGARGTKSDAGRNQNPT